MRHVSRLSAPRRQAATLIEVMIAVVLALGVTLTSIGSILYYQRTVTKNDRVAKLANLIEGQMEKVRNRTWFELVNPTNGLMPPGGSGNSTWPSKDGPFNRYKADSLSVELIKDGSLSATDYTGLSGKAEVFYTPITWAHEATDRLGTIVRYNVNYYKVEVVVTLDDASRIRPGTDDDVWGAVTYLSELSGRDDPEFSQRVLEVLRQKQY
jgi:type II secretory pathway pseudopilin PulG